jgi:2-methylisocitrate lyase-like PEP mutase family enzyme
VDKKLRLKSLISNRETILIPGVYDCISAKVSEMLGFSAIAISGYGLEASVLGNPDIGLATKSDVVVHARYIARAVDIPVICDADTGYGSAINVWEMVKEFEAAGISGIHIEDQAMPKKCGAMQGRSLVSTEEMKNKIQAAIEARADSNFAIIARSDAKSDYGIDHVIRRYNEYLDAGADLVLIGEHYELEELKIAAQSVKGPLCMCGGVPGWEESLLTVEEYQQIGIKMLLYPFSTLYAGTRALFSILGTLKRKGGIEQSDVDGQMLRVEEFNDLIGLPDWLQIEKKYSAG